MSSVVATAIVNTYCQPIDVSNILNVTFSTTSVPTTAQVTDLIVRASSYVNQVTGHNWDLETVAEYHDAIGSGPRAGTIILRQRPVLSITEVAWWYGGIKAWMPGLQGFSEETVGVLQGPSTILDTFQTALVAGNTMQPQSYLVYYPEGKVVWNTMRLDSRQRYRVIYTWGYPVLPDFVRDLTSVIVALDVLTFWGSQLGVAEDIAMMRSRMESKMFRLVSRATQRPGTAIG